MKNPVEREGYLKKLEIDTGFSRGVLLEQIGVVQTEQPEVRISSGPRNKPVLSNIQRYEQILLSLLAQRHLPVGTLHAEDFSEGLYRDIAVLLLNGEHPSSVIDRLYLPEEKVEREIDFGPDCRDKLAKALKDGIERRAQRAKRKQVKDGVEKGDKNAIPAAAK